MENETVECVLNVALAVWGVGSLIAAAVFILRDRGPPPLRELPFWEAQLLLPHGPINNVRAAFEAGGWEAAEDTLGSLLNAAANRKD